jgi:3',5'-cyclic AMP phosphodiesterase CpdA
MSNPLERREIMSKGKSMTRRSFLKATTTFTAASMLPFKLVDVCWGKEGEKFTFGVISDSHLTHIKGTKFVNNFDKGLQQAVAEIGLMWPQPDFIVFGGDLAQLGKKEEIDHGLEMLSKIEVPIKFVIGEHDFYLDMGRHWEEKASKLHYSFDHKGVHFVALNSILTYEDWIKRWRTPEERMLQMARLDNPQGSPFMVGLEQINWLKTDLSKVSHDTPIIVLSHSPLYKIFKPWNFWTDDAEVVQGLLRPFKKVTVLHGHVHQILYNQIENMMTVFMNRADPFHERDATGWSQVTLEAGRVSQHFDLWENTSRTIAYDQKAGHFMDSQYQHPSKRISPQMHY